MKYLNILLVSILLFAAGCANDTLVGVEEAEAPAAERQLVFGEDGGFSGWQATPDAKTPLKMESIVNLTSAATRPSSAPLPSTTPNAPEIMDHPVSKVLSGYESVMLAFDYRTLAGVSAVYVSVRGYPGHYELKDFVTAIDASSLSAREERGTIEFPIVIPYSDRISRACIDYSIVDYEYNVSKRVGTCFDTL